MADTNQNLISLTDWDALVAACPPITRERFTSERARRLQNAKDLLAALERDQGGLTTYCRYGSHAGAAHLANIGVSMERLDMEARINRLGVVEAYKQLVQELS